MSRRLLLIRSYHTYHDATLNSIKYVSESFVEPTSGHMINMNNVGRVCQHGPYVTFEMQEMSYSYKYKSDDDAKLAYEKMTYDLI